MQPVEFSLVPLGGFAVSGDMVASELAATADAVLPAVDYQELIGLLGEDDELASTVFAEKAAPGPRALPEDLRGNFKTGDLDLAGAQAKEDDAMMMAMDFLDGSYLEYENESNDNNDDNDDLERFLGAETTAELDLLVEQLGDQEKQARDQGGVAAMDVAAVPEGGVPARETGPRGLVVPGGDGMAAALKPWDTEGSENVSDEDSDAEGDEDLESVSEEAMLGDGFVPLTESVLFMPAPGLSEAELQAARTRAYRARKIRKWLAKRPRRTFSRKKQVLYDSRTKAAKKRPRVAGKFVKQEIEWALAPLVFGMPTLKKPKTLARKA